MVIATRELTYRGDDGDIAVPIRLFAPERKADLEWICRFQIEWPDEKVERWATGIDAVQAIWLTLQMIGAEIYASDDHKHGRLKWFEEGTGYGFPVTKNIRDLLVGDDRRFS